MFLSHVDLKLLGSVCAAGCKAPTWKPLMLSFYELPYLTLKLVFSQLPVSCDVLQLPFPTPRDNKIFISNL